MKTCDKALSDDRQFRQQNHKNPLGSQLNRGGLGPKFVGPLHMMKSLRPCLFILPFLYILAGTSARAEDQNAKTDWAQPQVVCAEEVIPKKPVDKACPDFSQLETPLVGWPAHFPDAQIAAWKQDRKALQYCRTHDILRREAQKPGSQSYAEVEYAWMIERGATDRQIKIDAIYEASRRYKMPTQVLAGALNQESLYADLGITDDGGNFSCGVGQVNASEWCGWAQSLSDDDKKKISWPLKSVSCSQISPGMVSSFYTIAKTHLNGTPGYRLNKSHFAGIKLEDVASALPQDGEENQNERFTMLMSFINNCTDPRLGIAAKGHELAHLYAILPAVFQQKDTYKNGEKFNRKCQQEGYQGSYPLDSAWLFTVGMYNAGPQALDLLAYYNRWTSEDLNKPETWAAITPVRLVRDIFESGHYNISTDRMEIKDLNGHATTWGAYKTCVLQQHLSRVVGGVTVPDVTLVPRLIAGECQKASFNPDTKQILKSYVPLARQKSSGQRPVAAAAPASPKK